MQSGMVYNIQRMSIQDGPGLRTTVFLKGCPLRCLWCSNPESQSARRQLLTFEGVCVHCGKCLEVCPRKAVYRDGADFRTHRELCDDCGVCAEACPAKARVISGKEMTVDEVMSVVRKDGLFYRNSGGGVTFSGGEPASSPGFLLALLEASHAEGIHTCLDTSGFVPWESLSGIVQNVDMVFFDCKHMDAERHRVLTGQDNMLILENMSRIARLGIPMHVRVPLMPGINDSIENIRSLSGFLRELGISGVDVLPCHTLGRSKYAALGLDPPAMEPYSPEELAETVNLFKECSLAVNIV